MLFQNPYLALANRRLRILGRLEIVAACVIVVGSVGCAHKAKTPPTEVEVAKPVRTDVPLYSEWIERRKATTRDWSLIRLANAANSCFVTGVKLLRNPNKCTIVTTRDWRSGPMDYAPALIR